MIKPTFVLPTKERGKVFELMVNASAPTVLQIVAIDSHDVHTAYIDSSFQLRQGITTIQMPVPLSPESLSFFLTVHNPQAKVTVLSATFDLEIVKKPIQVSEDVRKYIEAIVLFSKNASHEKDGHFFGTKDEGTNWYYVMDIEIPDGKGGTMIANTPAATFVESGNMFVSKRYMMRMTVPIRIFTLLHEHAHYALGLASDPRDPRIEQKCDEWAQSIFYALGYTEMDLQNLVGQALSNTSTNHTRMTKLNQKPNYTWR